MMTMNPAPTVPSRFYDDDNLPLSGGKLFTYAAGTTTKQATYTDSTGGTQNSNPIILNARGEASIYVDPNLSYKFVLAPASDTDPPVNPVWTQDNVPGGDAPMPIGTFTNASSLTVPAGIDLVLTSGYAATGQGAARYIYDAAVDASYVTANPRTSFRTVNSRGFRLDPQQRLTLEMFGAVADWNGSAGTDNYAAIMAALQFKPDSSRNFSPPVHAEVGRYYCSTTVEPRTSFHLIGASRGQDGSSVVGFSSTWFVFPNTQTCFLVPEANTVGLGTGSAPSASGSRFEDLTISHVTQGTDLTKHGIHFRTRITAERVTFVNISGNGFHTDTTAGSGGSTEGNANNWRIENSLVLSCGGDGLHIHGSDANAGVCIGFQTKSCGGCGVLDMSGLGNTYIGINIAGYGNGGVNYSGRNYQLIASQGNASLGSTTTPGTNNTVWYDIGAGSPSANFPTWVSGTSYRYMMPFAAFGFSNRSVFIGGYTEYGAVASHLEGPALAFGGQNGLTRYSAFLYGNPGDAPIMCHSGVGGRVESVAGTALATDMGTYEFTALGTIDPQGADFSPNILEHRRQKDGELSWYWHWSNNDQIYGFHNAKAAFIITGPNTPRTLGRVSTQPHFFGLCDLALIDPGNSNNARVLGMRSAAPTTGIYAQGDIFFNVNAANGGVMGWVCTAGGAIATGAWQPSTYYAVNSVVTNGGNTYVCIVDAGPTASSGGPTGTGSSIVDGGATWKYVSTAFAFKTFGIIGATSAAHQANSTAPDVATLVSDFNALLSKLQTAGLMS